MLRHQTAIDHRQRHVECRTILGNMSSEMQITGTKTPAISSKLVMFSLCAFLQISVPYVVSIRLIFGRLRTNIAKDELYVGLD